MGLSELHRNLSSSSFSSSSSYSCLSTCPLWFTWLSALLSIISVINPSVGLNWHQWRSRPLQAHTVPPKETMNTCVCVCVWVCVCECVSFYSSQRNQVHYNAVSALVSSFPDTHAASLTLDLSSKHRRRTQQASKRLRTAAFCLTFECHCCFLSRLTNGARGPLIDIYMRLLPTGRERLIKGHGLNRVCLSVYSCALCSSSHFSWIAQQCWSSVHC